MSKFEITKRKNEEFQFNLKARNGEVILTSEGYTTKDNCKKGIESVKKNSPLDERYDRKVSSNNKPYFNLKASNGEVIGTSQLYENENNREIGIESVKKNAPSADIVDLTLVEKSISTDHEKETKTETENNSVKVVPDTSELSATTATKAASLYNDDLEEDTYTKEEEEEENEESKKSNWNWLKYLLLLLALLLVLFFVWKSCTRTYDMALTANEPKEIVEEVVTVETITPEVKKEPTVLTLPNGIKLDAYKGGIEDQLITFLQSDEYKNATENDLKNKWFNFDNIEFKFNSGTELTESSYPQLDNVVEILKYFKDAKIKIGAYTDKVGTEAVNMKISQERANTVKSIIGKDIPAKQIIAAEGYGDKFATHSKDASDSERAHDRIIALRFVK